MRDAGPDWRCGMTRTAIAMPDEPDEPNEGAVDERQERGAGREH